MKNKKIDELIKIYEEQTQEDNNETEYIANKTISECEVSECAECCCCLYCCG